MKKNTHFIIFLLLATINLLAIKIYYDNHYHDDLRYSLPDIKAKAEQGNAQAQYNIGLAYATGKGVKQDYTYAIKWLKQAGVQGYVKAQLTLGQMYYTGTGVKLDYNMAAQWFDEACDNGSPEGCRMYQQLRTAGYNTSQK
ncbi:MAG: tetratricopeptide repeat protein [Chlorobiaceae bacterium]